MAVLVAVGTVAGQGVILRQKRHRGALPRFAELTAERGLHTAVGLFHPEARLPHLVGQIL